MGLQPELAAGCGENFVEGDQLCEEERECSAISGGGHCTTQKNDQIVDTHQSLICVDELVLFWMVAGFAPSFVCSMKRLSDSGMASTGGWRLVQPEKILQGSSHP